MKSIYISGKISNDDFAKIKFGHTSRILLESGYNKVINPFELKPFLGIKKYWFYMISDIFALIKCKEIYMISGWEKSKVAKIELAVAILLNKKIILQ